MHLRRYALAALIVGMAATGGVVLARGGSVATPAQATGATSSGYGKITTPGWAVAGASGRAASTTALATKGSAARSIAGPGSTTDPAWSGHGGDGGGGHGMGGPAGELGGRDGGRGLTVTAVHGATIMAHGWGSQVITVTVSASTIYTEAGAPASLTDVTAGSQIAVQGAGASAGTVSATGVTIILPRVQGVVTAVNGTSVTLSDFRGTAHTIKVTGTTRYQRAGQSAALSDVTVGSALVAEGTTDAGGTLTAVRMTIQVARLAGQVATVTVSSLTLTSSFGPTRTYTVTTSASTTYISATGASTTTAALKTGSYVEAEGALSPDGATMAALRVVILPADEGAAGHSGGPSDRGGFGHGGRRGFGPGAFGSDGIAPPSAGTAPPTGNGNI